MRLFKFLKDFLLYTGLLRVLAPFNNLFLFIRNFNTLRQWIMANNHKGLLINDFYVYKRNYAKRFALYEAVASEYDLNQKEMLYLEYGVASGQSFSWWVQKNKHPASLFFGFDTFEGLPESWGRFYKKGDMAHQLTDVDIHDNRVTFIKGVFQQTLSSFSDTNRSNLQTMPKLIHLDADLFSSTIFVLSQLFPFLNKGDIILFDEFNVANHEFFAYKIFTEAFYIKLRLIGAQNNFYQTAFIVD